MRPTSGCASLHSGVPVVLRGKCTAIVGFVKNNAPKTLKERGFVPILREFTHCISVFDERSNMLRRDALIRDSRRDGVTYTGR